MLLKSPKLFCLNIYIQTGKYMFVCIFRWHKGIKRTTFSRNQQMLLWEFSNGRCVFLLSEPDIKQCTSWLNYLSFFFSPLMIKKHTFIFNWKSLTISSTFCFGFNVKEYQWHITILWCQFWKSQSSVCESMKTRVACGMQNFFHP